MTNHPPNSVVPGSILDHHDALIAFSGEVVLDLSEKRLESTYVGVRRVRPSSHTVRQALVTHNHNTKATSGNPKGAESEADQNTTTAASHGTNAQKLLVFKIVGEDGVERRMTKQEKKAMKWQLQNEKKEAKLQQRLQREQQQQLERQAAKKNKRKKRRRAEEGENGAVTQNSNDAGEQEGNPTTSSIPTEGNNLNNILPLPGHEDGDHHSLSSDGWLNATAVTISQQQREQSLLEQELADLRGERQGVPPVMLPPPLARLAVASLEHKDGVIASTSTDYPLHIVWDENLAQDWALALKQSMIPAEQTRQQEDMRPMAYELVPAVWTRLRPPSLALQLEGNKDTLQQRADSASDGGMTPREAGEAMSSTAARGLERRETEAKEDENARESKKHNSQTSWSMVAMRPAITARSYSFDRAVAVVSEYLHRHFKLHLSCGVKFGCDLLLYDGPRTNRHAFAGLRVVVGANTPTCNATETNYYESPFPLPSAYALAGYVRCLNTAGKLALLAFVSEEDISPPLPENCKETTKYRLAVVDLKLQRVDGTKRQNMQDRLRKLHRSTKSTLSMPEQMELS